MPLLIVKFPQTPVRGMVLTDRVVIGRRPFNDIVVADPQVSRIHAWIGIKGGKHLVFDAGSRGGTLLNGEPLKDPRELADGDELRIGPASITFIDMSQLPDDVPMMEPGSDLPTADPYDGGIYFDCPCGGPMWVTFDLAGAAGRCRYCGQRLVVPHHSGQRARPLMPVGSAAAATRPAALPAAPPSAPPPLSSGMVARRAETVATKPAMPICSICQTPLHQGEDQTRCPSCHLTFHSQCWLENKGCSAYGCDQVSVLAEPQETPPEIATVNGTGADDDLPLMSHHQHKPFPWDMFLFNLSFLGLGLGVLSYGMTSAAMLIWTIVFQSRGKIERRGLGVLATVISLIGVLAGLAMSLFWWNQLRVWDKFI